MPRQIEHSLQTLVIKHLTQHHEPDVFWFAIPNAGRRTFRAASKLKAEGMLRGAPDLVIVLPKARTGWLELKAPGGRMSDDQWGFQARCQRLGHQYACAFELSAAIGYLRLWGAVKGEVRVYA
jgi:hypothetical protein